MTRRVLVVRLDSDGDVLLAGPAIRAIAAGGQPHVTLLCSPAGRQAAGLLPGVDRVVCWECPWIVADPPQVDAGQIGALVAQIRGLEIEVAVVLTSFHQSPLPLALMLRMAGVVHIVGISTDYPGSLLDIRLRPGLDFAEELPEHKRSLVVAAAAGFPLPSGDDGRLKIIDPPDAGELVGPGRYVVVHPGATAPARMWPPARSAEAVDLLHGAGYRVMVTGSPAESELTAAVAGTNGTDLGGRTSYPMLAGVLLGADCVVVGNTGPAHLAAAVRTPIVSLFAPVVPAGKWAPPGVPVVLLGDQDAACRDSRARECPIPGHPCLASVTAADVVSAVGELTGVPV